MKKQALDAAASAAVTITDPEAIRRWAEARGGKPAIVRDAHAMNGKVGILRLDFREPDGDLRPLSWDEFFETFEEAKLALLVLERTEDGCLGEFHEFVKR